MAIIRRQISFMASETGKPNAERSLFHVVPVPLEKTVSYGTGTRRGPQAVLKASQYLEIFDGSGIPLEKGIYTHKKISCRGDIEKVLDRISVASKNIR